MRNIYFDNIESTSFIEHLIIKKKENFMIESEQISIPMFWFKTIEIISLKFIAITYRSTSKDSNHSTHKTDLILMHASNENT